MSKTSRQAEQMAQRMVRAAAAEHRRQAALAAAALHRQQEAALRLQQEAAARAAAIRRQAIIDNQNGGPRVRVDLRHVWLRSDVSAVAAAAGSDQPDLYREDDHYRLGNLHLPGRFVMRLQGWEYEGPIWQPAQGGWQEIKLKSSRGLSGGLAGSYAQLAEWAARRGLSGRLAGPYAQLTQRTAALQVLRQELAAQAEAARQQHRAELDSARRAIQVRREAEILENVVVQTICLCCGAPPPPRGKKCRFCGTVAA